VTPAPVTVIIPAYNSRPWIREAVESVLNQSAPASEIIVIDDGSTDGTSAELAGYGSRVQCVSQANSGVAAARNAGLRHATGELIAFLDADDIWHPRKLEIQMRVMADDPGIGLLGTRVFDWPAPHVPDVGGEDVSRVTCFGQGHMAVKNHLVTSSVMVRREVVKRAGEFDPLLRGPEDHDYWLRATEVTRVGRLDAALTGYRRTAGSLSTQTATMEAGMRRILQKLDERGWPDGRRWRRRAYSYSHYSWAYMQSAAGRPGRALKELAKSVALYPLPYERMEVSMSLARPRMFGVLMLRMLRALPEESRSQRAGTDSSDGSRS
jgi:glycosyltransferase involved in cell wall biosynthesis